MTHLLAYLVQFLEEGTPWLLCILPLYGLWRLAVWYDPVIPLWKHTAADRLREARLVLLTGYLVLLFTQTFEDYGTESELRLVPLQMIVTQTMEAVKSPTGVRAFLFNIIGNMAVFVPIGWLTAALYDGNFRQTVLTGFGLSLFIETVQLPLNRTSDVDDLLLNTLGAAIGCGVWRMIERLRQRDVKHKRRQ